MVRIIYKSSAKFDGKFIEYKSTKECDVVLPYGKVLYCLVVEKGEYGIMLTDVIKVEKQVKDLTLEECDYLHLIAESNDDWCSWKVYKDNDLLSMDDYIDITALVKGGKNAKKEN